MLFDLIASETSPLSLSEEDVAALAACERGTILLDVAARADATLIALTGTNGWITLSLRAGRLDGEQVLGEVGRPEEPSGAGSAGGLQRRVLDAEDALGLDDGRPHTIAVTVNETGTHLYADGYECFSTTLPAFLAQIGLTEVRIDPDGIAVMTHWSKRPASCSASHGSGASRASRKGSSMPSTQPRSPRAAYRAAAPLRPSSSGGSMG